MNSGEMAVDVRHRRGTLDLDATLTVAPGEVVALVGPNGAGKSTLLQVIAGLVKPDHGTITIGAEVLHDDHIDLPPADRRLGVVFQDYLLFDHMSVGDNVAFGPRSRGAPVRRANQTARKWLDRVGLEGSASARPATLSGGQRQRVALARALASDPRSLLLDEPLSALDADTRGTVRRELRRHLADFEGPVLLVTHEPLEALALADRLVVLEDGKVTQSGSSADVARRPRSDWVARLVGVNLFTGRSSAGGMAVDGGGRIVVGGPVPQGAILATVHPRSISLHRERPAGSPRNVWDGHVQDIEMSGDRVRVQVACTPPLIAEVTAPAMADLGLVDGGRVWISFKASDVQAYPR